MVIKLHYKWTLNRLQTARAGECRFSLGFYLNLEDDFYQYNPDITTLDFVTENNLVKVITSTGETKIIDKFYSLISNSDSFSIVDNGIGEGEEVHFESFESKFLLLQKQVALLMNNLTVSSFDGGEDNE